MSEHTSESALTTDTPTPCRPPETLQPLCSPPNLPPACSTYTTHKLPFVLLTLVCQRIWETILHLYCISHFFQSQTINCNNIAACLMHRHQPDNQKFVYKIYLEMGSHTQIAARSFKNIILHPSVLQPTIILWGSQYHSLYQKRQMLYTHTVRTVSSADFPVTGWMSVGICSTTQNIRKLPLKTSLQVPQEGIRRIPENTYNQNTEETECVTYPTPIVSNTDRTICMQDNVYIGSKPCLCFINCIVQYFIHLYNMRLAPNPLVSGLLLQTIQKEPR